MPLNYRQLSASPEVLSQTVGDEAVLLDLRSEEYFSLNAVGLRVWEMLQETGDMSVIRDRLLKEYEVTADDLERDLNALVSRLLEAGLVKETSGAPA
jgi:hypothetical protein